MKFLKNSFLSGLFIALIFPMYLRAQQFKWVKGGGSTYSAGRSADWEQVRHMCTDPNGNVYVLSNVGPTAISADTFHESAGNFNMLVTSYTCNGQMRWAKLIYATTENAYPAGIAADALGHIYVTGSMPPSAGVLHIGYDTTISGVAYEYEQMGLIQFDTSGVFHWIRFVGQNTPATGYGTLYYYMGSVLKMDGANNVHLFNYVSSGVPLTSSITSMAGTYDLMYSSSGSLSSVTRLDLDSEWFVNDAVINPTNNKLYLFGQTDGSLIVPGYLDTFYAAAFDASRNRLWMYFAGHGNDDGFTGIVMDSHKNLLFSGSSQSGRFSFNGDSVVGTGDIAVIVKTDTNGVVKWLRSFGCVGSSINGFTGITLLPNDKVAASGGYAGKVYYSNYNPPDSSLSSLGSDAYAVIVDSAGDPQIIQSIRGDGFDEAATAITSDRVGNIYIGGDVVDSIITGAGIPAYHSVGGETDFYVAKYGMDCSCTGIPMSAYIDTGTYTIGFTYTGSTSGIDSVVWTFDDGHSAIGATAIHTYTASGTYRACATVYTDCSNDIYCKDVVIHYSTATVRGQTNGEIKVYPNPANDELNVIGVSENTIYKLLSVAGVCVCQGSLLQKSNLISVKSLAAGIYFLVMNAANGERYIIRVIKD